MKRREARCMFYVCLKSTPLKHMVHTKKPNGNRIIFHDDKCYYYYALTCSWTGVAAAAGVACDTLPVPTICSWRIRGRKMPMHTTHIYLHINRLCENVG